MFTPEEIKNKEFKKAALGYHPEEVHVFLDKIASDYLLLGQDNMSLKDMIAQLSDKIAHFQHMENNISKTLLLAEKTAEEVLETAKKKESLILAEAENQALTIWNTTRQEVFEMQQQRDALFQEWLRMKSKIKALLQTELLLLEETEISKHENEPETEHQTDENVL